MTEAPVTILDGGTGRELERRGAPFRQPEWSALALYEAPEKVREVHESFVAVGADAITTNSYAIVPFHLGSRFAEDGERLLEVALDAATRAKRGGTLVLGSLPPTCGSYEPDKFDETIAEPVVATFRRAFAHVDAILCETVGSIREAAFYLDRLGNAKRIWLSFCLRVGENEERPVLLTGETLTEAVRALALDNVDVLLVNCCDVRLVLPAILELKAALEDRLGSSGLHPRLGAYPNAFSVPPPGAANHTLREVDFNITPAKLADAGRTWHAAGATVVGGCCGVGPEHIRALADALKGRDT